MNSTKKNLTLLDVQLARIYYPLLIDLAKHKHSLTYGELVSEAKNLHPHLDYVQNAFPLSIGRRLNAVWHFTEERELPDLTALLINKGKGEEGSDSFDKNMRQKIYNYDWSNVDDNFDLYSDQLEKEITPVKRNNEKEARSIMSMHYKENKNKYPDSIKKHRREIISLLMEGIDVQEVFRTVTIV